MTDFDPTLHIDIADVATLYGPGPWWWACQHPERLCDRFSIYSHDCPRCLIALQAVANTQPHLDFRYHDDDGNVTPTDAAGAFSLSQESYLQGADQ